MRIRGLVFLCSAMGAFCWPSPAAAQSILVVDGGACDGCELRIDTVAVLGGSAAPVSLSPFATVTLDSHGHWIAGPTFDGAGLALFERSGELSHGFGRAGEGPGEFRRIQSVALAPGDSVLVFDGVRASVVEPDLTAFARSYQLPSFVGDAHHLGDDMVGLHTPRAPGPLGNRPVLILDGTGDVLTTLGSPIGESSRRFDRARRIAASDSGHVWVARVASYEMTRWSIAPAEARVRVTRRADWFPEGTAYHPGEPYTVEPKPRVTDVLEDDDGRLWVSMLVADADWRRRDDPGDIPVDRMNMRELYDSVVEVVEWRDGRRVVASGRFDDAPVRFVDPSGRAGRDVLGYAAARDVYGDVRMMVLRLRP